MPVSLAILTSRNHHALFGGQPLFRAALRTLASKPEKALTTYFSQIKQETSQCFRSQQQSPLSDTTNAFTRQYTQMSQPKANANPSSFTALLPMAASFMSHQAEQLQSKTQDTATATHILSDRIYSL